MRRAPIATRLIPTRLSALSAERIASRSCGIVAAGAAPPMPASLLLMVERLERVGEAITRRKAKLTSSASKGCRRRALM